MPTRRRRRFLTLWLAALLLAPAAAVQARLDGKAWREAKERFEELFAEPGNAEAKKEVLATIAEDESGRAWRLMADGLFQEIEHFDALLKEIGQLSAEHGQVMQRGIHGFTPDDERMAHELQDKLKKLDALLDEERKAVEVVVTAVLDGPEDLRKNILRRAKRGDWTARAAALRISVRTMEEPESKRYLLRTLGKDDDPRVRMAGVEALATAAEGWEDLLIGRLGDDHWTIVVRAAQIAQERELHAAVPHLINALPEASPRVAEALGAALRALTGENFEAYADVWSKWWADHKDDFKADVEVEGGKRKEFEPVHFYGVEIKSDRVLFIIDISSSMKLETKNDNPAERWKPPPTVTGPNAPPPPPPPPESILSGPKIDVAKHELKKAIKSLPKEHTFNIICFNQGAVHWKETMQEASKNNKEDAYKWIRALKPHGSTYIDGALRLGFKIAGLIDYDKRYPDVHVDTIVLLSDGAPTDNSFPTSKLMDPEVILEHVREWNKNKQVIIHCIGVDMVEGIEFLQKLAKEHGGTYVDR